MNFIDQLSANMSVFSAATGLNVAILDSAGQTVVSFGDAYRFCRMFQAHTGAYCSCNSVHSKGGQFAATLGECYFYLCSAQLVHFSVAITEDNRYIGSVLVGPVLLSGMENVSVDMIMQRYNIPGGEREAYISALAEIPLIIEADRAYYIGKLLFQLVYNLLSHEDRQITLERRLVNQQQARIGECLQRLVDAGNPTQTQLRQEKELVERIAEGDLEGTQELLNNIIAHIYFSAGNNVELIKIRMNELMGVLSRVLLQTTDSPDTVYEIVGRFQRCCLGVTDLVELSHALADSLRVFIDLVRAEMANQRGNAIRKSRQYIEHNFAEALTVEQVAAHVSLSPSYFSHLFKDYTGMTFSAYLMDCRMDMAKKLLKKGGLSLAEIAQQLGYENQQYFSRVFKKKVGVTPGQYRKGLLPK